jgi:hypothetical protein
MSAKLLHPFRTSQAPLPPAERVWVIGNGPSLRAEDLTLLHERGELCIAMNRIHLIYDRTPWRPNAYCLVDRRRNPFFPSDVLLHAQQGYPCFIKDSLLVEMTPYCDDAKAAWIDQPWAENVVPLIQCKHDYLDVRPPAGWHPPYFCCFSGSMNMALQLAVLSGFRTVVLLGVDHRWQQQMVQNNADPNHFDPRYSGSLEATNERDWRVLPPVEIEQLKGEAEFIHAMAGAEAAARGVEILNASRQSDLLAYRRVELEDLL